MKGASLFMLAGESSGDQLGAAILDGLEAISLPTETWGIGGPAMSAKGFASLHPMESLTVMGLGEAVRAYPRLMKLADELIDAIMAKRPGLVLTIDSKGFSLRFARRLKKRMASSGWSAPIIHLVAPTVWAWGSWRARTVSRSVDHLLCLFPFELPYFNSPDLKVSCVGHPAADRKMPARADARRELGIGQEDPVLVLLPGSRRKEIDALLPDMLHAARSVQEKRPHCQFILPAAATVRPRIEAMIKDAGDIRIIPGEQLNTALKAADFGLICSGTVTLEAALAGLPGAVFYRGDRLAHVLQPIFVRRDRIVLPNAVLGREVYPLYLNREFDAQSMAGAALQGLGNINRREQMGQISRQLMEEIRVNAGGFGVAAAETIATALATDQRLSIGV